MLFLEAVNTLGSWAWLVEVGHCGKAYESHANLSPNPNVLLLDLLPCEEAPPHTPADVTFTIAFITMMG